ncbi:hypothetical protein H6G54_22900 [Anabaena cylindrica FACHB-243]|uniref:Uncharacterized protein n=1 Tax=Anabaena cylindrica (strain ATCC 27899 / PCC 7122) TaxID=272123 RepID=K9ZQ01_ANACC|nr:MULTISPECIES: hypothetical protein [Anabaena]AFZ60879.1 hypothetical protein Anacy_5570 [Anabaena cylindrica PCC 7122]MBD2420502.1 hypothetical protein [Anabaena cylindrica FACHB-243]MBY5284644.1 hypothetical protein [Anabaena sp. CCAP 1446/1C]MBY5309721.1 hypothetical protein [Anabaena sp. CCAP 1446/1C]MCM2406874.1 hypothetical protein [Anabaena sp. CCAP 1446/1C]
MCDFCQQQYNGVKVSKEIMSPQASQKGIEKAKIALIDKFGTSRGEAFGQKINAFKDSLSPEYFTLTKIDKDDSSLFLHKLREIKTLKTCRNIAFPTLVRYKITFPQPSPW